MTRDRVCFEADVPTDDGNDLERRRVTIDTRATEDIPVAEWDAADVVGRITTREPDARSYDDALPALPIPGSGEPITEDDDTEQVPCGESEPLMFCSDCGEPAVMGANCARSRCPECWERWAFRSVVQNPMESGTARGIAPKLEQFRLDSRNGKRSGLASEPSDTDAKGPFFQHVTVSFADRNVRFNSNEPLKQAERVAVGLAKATGLESMKTVYHPWRIAEEYRGEVRGHEAGDGDLTWKDIVGNGGLIDEYGWEYVRDEYLVFAPHFHVIGCGYVDVAQTPAIEAMTGVVVHRITSERNPNVSIYGLEELCAVAAYCLSHAGLQQLESGSYRIASTWYGRRLRNTTPGEYALEEADTAMREVADTVLGVSFTAPTCRAEHAADDDGAACGCGDCAGADEHDHDQERTPPVTPAVDTTEPPGPTTRSGGVTTTTAAADGGTDLSRPVRADSPVTGTWGREIETGETPAKTARCGGSLVPMLRADEYLECEDWCETIPDGTLERLEAAYDEYREQVIAADAIARPVDPPD